MIKIYHNPRCRKSRETLEIIRQAGYEPEIIEYLQEAPFENELKDILISNIHLILPGGSNRLFNL